MSPSRRIYAIAAGVLASVALGAGIAVAATDGEPVQPVCVPGTLGADGHFVIDCQVPVPVASTVISASPSPSPVVVPTTVTQTVTVSASPSAPTTAPTSTQPPSPTPTGSTATPTPSASTATTAGCMTRPSACGWPDQTNTGVPAGKALTVRQGDLTISTPGTVIDGLDIRGCVSVRATGVTIRNSRITCGSWYAIGVQAGTGSDTWVAPNAGLLVENVEIVMSSMDMKGIAFSGYTARRVWFHGGSDCAHFGQNVVVEDSFCDIPAGRNIGSAHIDGLQSDGGRNIVIRHNTIRVPYSQTSAILMSTNTSPIYDVSIVDNLMAGGGYTAYCATDSGGPVRGTFVFTGNRIAKTYFPKGGYWGPVVGCPSSGWTWD